MHSAKHISDFLFLRISSIMTLCYCLTYVLCRRHLVDSSCLAQQLVGGVESCCGGERRAESGEARCGGGFCNNLVTRCYLWLLHTLHHVLSSHHPQQQHHHRRSQSITMTRALSLECCPPLIREKERERAQIVANRLSNTAACL